MINLTDKQEELLLVALDEMRESFVYVKNRLDILNNKLEIYTKRQYQLIAHLKKAERSAAARGH